MIHTNSLPFKNEMVAWVLPNPMGKLAMINLCLGYLLGWNLETR